jgi:hypothetical protein
MENIPTAWRLDPLPDFMLDHTFAEKEPPARLREVVTRWVQFIGTLWSWRDEAGFAIRWETDGQGIRGWLLAVAHDGKRTAELQGDLRVLLRTHRLGGGEAPALRETRKLTHYEVRQFATDKLWIPPSTNRLSPEEKQAFPWLNAPGLERVNVPFPWWAPGGHSCCRWRN